LFDECLCRKDHGTSALSEKIVKFCLSSEVEINECAGYGSYRMMENNLTNLSTVTMLKDQFLYFAIKSMER